MAFTQDITRPPVKSEPLDNGKPVSRPKGGGEWAIGTTLLVFGAIGWLTGARYTLIGWVIGLNLFFDWLGLPVAVPTPTGWWVLTMIPIALIYSRVEMQVWRVRNRHGQALALFMIGWALIVATDVGSTYIGVRSPAADAWPVTLTIAASAGIAFAWAAVLTFVSDWLILGGWKLITR